MFDFKGFIKALLRKKSGDPMSNLKSATIWVQELPQRDVHRAQIEIIGALISVNEKKTTSLRERIRVLTYLDEKAVALQQTLCREYLLHGDEPESDEAGYLPTITSFFNEMAAGYQQCIRLFAAKPGSNKIRQQLPLLTARAIYHFAMQAKWARIRYQVPDPAVWRNLHRFYLFAEREEFSALPLKLYPHDKTETTCAAEYMQALMLHLSNPESLLPLQIDLVDRWLDNWAKSITIEHEFRPHRQIYAVNVSDMKPPRKLRRNMIGEKYRYWGVGLLLVNVNKTIEQIKQGELPARLKLGEDCRLPACLELIESMAKRWSGAGNARQHDRQPNVKRVEVARGLVEVFAQLKRKRSASAIGSATPVTLEIEGMSAATGDRLGAPSPELFKARSEEWIMENESVSGVGVNLTNPPHGLRIGMLLGLKPEAETKFAIGIVRRLSATTPEKVFVGIHTLSQTPILVELGTLEAGVPSARAIYLPEQRDAAVARSLIMEPEAYRRGRVVELKAQGKSYSVRLQNALDQASDYCRVAFDVMAKN